MNPGTTDSRNTSAFVDDRAEGILRGMQGVDVLIADCSYTEQEYAAERLGHGTFNSSIQYARDT